jgi:hypothetical protein
MSQVSKEKLKDANMYLVGFESTRILTNEVQKYPRTLRLDDS